MYFVMQLFSGNGVCLKELQHPLCMWKFWASALTLCVPLSTVVGVEVMSCSQVCHLRRQGRCLCHVRRQTLPELPQETRICLCHLRRHVPACATSGSRACATSGDIDFACAMSGDTDPACATSGDKDHAYAMSGEMYAECLTPGSVTLILWLR